MLLPLTGCGDVKRSSRYYEPIIVGHTAKHGNVPIPVLKTPPKRPYQVVGKMVFETDEGINFVYRSLRYNARVNGADAVIMRMTPKRPDLMDAFVEAQMIVFPQQIEQTRH